MTEPGDLEKDRSKRDAWTRLVCLASLVFGPSRQRISCNKLRVKRETGQSSAREGNGRSACICTCTQDGHTMSRATPVDKRLTAGKVRAQVGELLLQHNSVESPPPSLTTRRVRVKVKSIVDGPGT